MEGEQASTTEDIQNIPRILRNLDVQGLKDKSCLLLMKRCFFCFMHGKGDPRHRDKRYLASRTRTFQGKGVNGFSPQHLAETGLFRTHEGNLTCYQCNQTLLLFEGEDPLEKHADMYPNCKHVCKVLGRRPRSVISSLTSPPRPSTGRRRRLFSE